MSSKEIMFWKRALHKYDKFPAECVARATSPRVSQQLVKYSDNIYCLIDELGSTGCPVSYLLLNVTLRVGRSRPDSYF